MLIVFPPTDACFVLDAVSYRARHLSSVSMRAWRSAIGECPDRDGTFGHRVCDRISPRPASRGSGERYPNLGPRAATECPTLLPSKGVGRAFARPTLSEL